MSLLQELPNPKQLDGLLAGKFSPAMLGVDDIKSNINVNELSNNITLNAPHGLTGGLTVPSLPTSLSKEGFIAQLSGPLDGLKSINSASLIGNISSGSLPVTLPKPSFDINTVMTGITSKVLSTRIAVPSFEIKMPGLSDVAAPLSQMSSAVATTPMRLLNMMLKVLESLVKVVNNPDNLIRVTQQSLTEIYGHQIQTLQDQLPLVALQNSIDSLENGFLGQYQNLLDEIDILSENDAKRLQKILTDAQTNILPSLQRIEQARISLENLKLGDTTALSEALDAVIEFTEADEVFLKKYFEALGNQTGQFLAGITPPVQQLAGMANNIQTYLEQAAGKGQEAAQKVSETIEHNINQVGKLLNNAQTKIAEIEQQIKQFLDKLDVAPAVTKVKDGCNQISHGVEQFFTKVEELKQKLDEAVAQIQGKVDHNMAQAFNEIEAKIRQLLAEMTGILNRQEVKEALEQAKQGIEQFKNTIDEASLKPVFDLVINKTGDLESSIKSIDVARLGTPQKTALKVGSKVIQEVKVDEIIKPELVSAFQEIQKPLEELIELLKGKVLEIENTINAFNPGTLATDKILNSDPYQLIMSTLEELQPSQLLAPLKEVNAKLTALVDELDPQKIIDEVQNIYDQFTDLVEALSPEPLNRMIGEAMEVASFQLEQVRDSELENIVTTIKDSISVEKLLEGTGIQEIAEAQFWQILKDVLGGAYLSTLTNAMAQVDSQFASRIGTMDFSGVMAQLQTAQHHINHQITVDLTIINKRVLELDTFLGNSKEQVRELQERRRQLRVRYQDDAEINKLLMSMDMTPLVELSKAVRRVKGLDQDALKNALESVVTKLQSQKTALNRLTESQLQNAVPTIFRKQIGTPVRQWITLTQTQLQPFSHAVSAIENIVITLTTMPARIDQSVGMVLETLRSNLRRVINETLSTIQTFRESLTGTLNAISDRVQTIVNDLSPSWMLNAFADSDFAAQGMLAFAKRISNPSRDVIAALLQTKLTPDELALLQSATTADAFLQGHRNNVLKALNSALRDNVVCAPKNYETVKANIDKKINELHNKLAVDAAKTGASVSEEQRQQSIEDFKQFYRYKALRGQLLEASIKYNSGRDKKNAKIRFNRLILEAHYRDDIMMSLQSLHPYIVAQVSQLYPEQTVQRLDDTYAGILDKVKQFPDQMIRAPLDDEFNKIKAILKENFDIAGLFNVLGLKLDGMDEDLSEGLDRLSAAYAQLLAAFDARLT
jgi:hypothetical protein